MEVRAVVEAFVTVDVIACDAVDERLAVGCADGVDDIPPLIGRDDRLVFHDFENRAGARVRDFEETDGGMGDNIFWQNVIVLPEGVVDGEDHFGIDAADHRVAQAERVVEIGGHVR